MARTWDSSSAMPSLPASGNRLVAGGDDGFQPEALVQGEEGHQRNDGGAVRVGDDVAGVVEGRFRVDFRHHQGHVRVLAEGGGIVDDHAARGRGNGGELQGNAAACAEQGDVHAVKGFFRQFFHSQHFSPEGDLFSGGPGGGQKLQEPTGKLRVSRQDRISTPTAPVAPTMATWGAWFMVVSENGGIRSAWV